MINDEQGATARDLRITSVFPCVARGFKARISFRFRGCHWRTAAPLAALVLAPEAYGFTDAGTVTAHADIPACC